MNLLFSVGLRITTLRCQKEHTEFWLWKITGVPVEVIKKVELGEYKAPYSVYDDVCRALGTTFKDLMKGYKWTYIEPMKGVMNNEIA